MKPPADALRRQVARLVTVAVRLPADYAKFDALRRAVVDDGVGGILLFGGDLDLAPRFLRQLREAAPRGLLVMSDVERGVGQQVEGCLRLPPPMAVGALRDPAAAFALGRATAIECRKVGIDAALAPVLDLYNEPRNPIVGPRCFGEDPDIVATLGAAWIDGCQGAGVLACAKHFPGHGRTLADSHDDLPRVDASRAELERDLAPFARAVKAGVRMVMTAHVAYPALAPDLPPDTPATLAAPILQGLLRRRMGFDGLIMTDALLMEGVRRAGGEGEAAVRSLEAGCDLLLCPTDPAEVVEAVAAAVEAGRLPASRLDEASATLDAALRFRDLPRTGRRLEPLDEYRAFAMAGAAVTVLRDPGRLLPLRKGEGRGRLALVLDDDAVEGRGAALRDLGEEFGAGVLRRIPGQGGAEEVMAAAAAADRVVVLLYGDTRAWKGRPGMAPDLAKLVSRLQERLADRCVFVLFGGPALAPPPGPGTVVAAWDDAGMVQRAALDLLLSGRVPTGTPPFGPDPLAEGPS
jgi:beta-glucosidase-like glycosyl hydrolase